MMDKTRLGGVVTINPDSVTQNFPYQEIEYIEISSVGSGTLETTKTIAIEEAPSRAKRLIQDGDTILSTVRPNRRSFLYIKNPLPNTVVSTGFAVLRASDAIDERFLYYVVNHQAFTDYLTARAKGAAYPAVDTDTIADAEIPFPPLPIQRKIAGILSAYDDLIENNTRRIKILEEMAQRIYREWFVNFRFPGHERVKMVDSELGMIPEGWEVRSIGEVIEYHIGGGWGKEEETQNYVVPAYVIRGTDIPPAREGKIDDCPLRFHTESNFRSRKLFDGDIVFEVSGGSKNQPLGRTLLVSRTLLNVFKEDVICASFCKLIRPNRKLVNSELLYLHLLEIYDNREITQYQVQSTGISNFKFSIFFDRHRLAVPKKSIMDEFGEIVSSFCEEIQVLGRRNSNLRQTRDLLLPKLISGELDVSELDIDIGEGENNAA